MDPGHKAKKKPSDNADLGFQAVGSALRIMQLNVEGLSADIQEAAVARFATSQWRHNWKSAQVVWNLWRTNEQQLFL